MATQAPSTPSALTKSLSGELIKRTQKIIRSFIGVNVGLENKTRGHKDHFGLQSNVQKLIQ